MESNRNSTLNRLMAAIDRSVSAHHATDECLAEKVCIAAALPAGVLDDDSLHVEFDRLAQLVGTDRDHRLPGIGSDPAVLLVASQLKALAPRIWTVRAVGNEMRAVEVRRAMRSPRRVAWYRPSFESEFVEEAIALGWMLKGDALFTLSRLQTEVGESALHEALDALSESFDRKDSTEDFWHAALGYFLMARVIDRQVATGVLADTTVSDALEAHADAVFALAHLLYHDDDPPEDSAPDAPDLSELSPPELYVHWLEVADTNGMLQNTSLEVLELDGGDLHRIQQALDSVGADHQLSGLPRNPAELLAVSGFGSATMDSLAHALDQWMRQNTQS